MLKFWQEPLSHFGGCADGCPSSERRSGRSALPAYGVQTNLMKVCGFRVDKPTLKLVLTKER